MFTTSVQTRRTCEIPRYFAKSPTLKGVCKERKTKYYMCNISNWELNSLNFYFSGQV